MKTLAEQIKALEATRAAKAAAMEKILQKAADEGRSTDEAEAEEFDTAQAEIEQIDKDLQRLKRMQEIQAKTAKPVAGTGDEPRGGSKTGAVARAVGTTIIMSSGDKDEKFKGQNFTRMAIAKALAHIAGGGVRASDVAESRWGKTNPTLVAVLKANEVAAGSDLSGAWGAELVQADTRYTGDFIQFLYSKTVFDQLPLREVPANVVIKGQDGQATAYWVGQGKAIPATTDDFSTVTLTPLKVAAIAAITNELLMDSSPAAEALVQDALGNASGQRIDTTFLSAVAAVSGVSPAGILNGLSGIASSGNTDADIRDDVLAAYGPFLTAKNASGLTWVMQPGVAKALQLSITALGQQAFPQINAQGGSFLGDPVVTGDNVPSGDIILLKPSDIYKIGDTGVEISVSQQATIEQSSAPTGSSATAPPVAGSAVMQSMFQTESTAIKIVRRINFAKRRASAVAFLSGVAYGTPTSP